MSVSLLRPRTIAGSAQSARLGVAELLHTTDLAAEDVLDGRYDNLLPAPGTNGFSWLGGDDDLDVWLVGWSPHGSLGLHDYGEAQGAITVLSGELIESRWDGEKLRDRRLAAGDQAGIPEGWVHHVRPAPTADPALSVHAFSPPLSAMSYYDIAGRGWLRHRRTELTAHPAGAA